MRGPVHFFFMDAPGNWFKMKMQSRERRAGGAFGNSRMARRNLRSSHVESRVSMKIMKMRSGSAALQQPAENISRRDARTSVSEKTRPRFIAELRKLERDV